MTLTKEQIEALEPGRESDLLIARVFGTYAKHLPTTDIWAAWKLFHHFPKYDVTIEKCKLIAPESPEWLCSFYWLGLDGQILHDPVVDAWGSTAPMAICKASLLLKLEEEGNNA